MEGDNTIIKRPLPIYRAGDKDPHIRAIRYTTTKIARDIFNDWDCNVARKKRLHLGGGEIKKEELIKWKQKYADENYTEFKIEWVGGWTSWWHKFELGISERRNHIRYIGRLTLCLNWEEEDGEVKHTKHTHHIELSRPRKYGEELPQPSASSFSIEFEKPYEGRDSTAPMITASEAMDPQDVAKLLNQTVTGLSLTQEEEFPPGTVVTLSSFTASSR